MRSRSIARRITAWFAALSSAVLLAFGGYLYLALDAHFKEQDTAELNGRVELVRHILADFQSEAELSTNVHRFQNTLVGKEGLHLSVLSSTGQELFSSRRYQVPEPAWGETADTGTAPKMASTWSPAPGIQYRVVSAWGQFGARAQQRVRIILALDASQHHEALRRYWDSLIAALIVGLAASIFLGWWITRRELRPVQRIAGTARTISASRLGERLDLAGAPVELRPLAEAFNTMLERLEQSFVRLSDFSSDLAHELRTPIHNLMTHCQVVLNRTRPVEEYRRVLEANVEELECIASMVEDMLFLARADQAQAVLTKETFDLREAADKVSSYFEALLEERGLRVACEGNATAQADRSLVERVIGNLLSNAVRHSAPESTIRVLLGHADSRARIEVTNTGPGIPAELQERVFDRFFQVSPSRSQGDAGSGLGLAIVKSIMALHNGSVTVASRPEGPTTFTASFPA